ESWSWHNLHRGKGSPGALAPGAKEYARNRARLRNRLARSGRTGRMTGITLEHPTACASKEMAMLDDWLRDYYQTGNPDSLQNIVQGLVGVVIRVLDQCVADRAVRVRI